MGKRIPRDEIIRNLKDKVARGEPIVGCGAGTGISAKFEEAGGADLMIMLSPQENLIALDHNFKNITFKPTYSFNKADEIIKQIIDKTFTDQINKL